MSFTTRRKFTRLTLIAAIGLTLGFGIVGGVCNPAAAETTLAKVPEVAALLPPSIQASGKLRVAIPDTGKPLAYKEGSELKGMDPDLARAVAAVLGLRPELDIIPFASALTGLQSDKYDISYGEFYVTAKRLQVADFVSNWKDFSSFLVMTSKNFTPKAIADICGHIVGAMAGSAELEILKKASDTCAGKPPTVSAFPSVNNSVLALDSGRVDAVLIGRGSAESALQLDSRLAATGEIGGGPTATAVARNDNSEKMLQALKAAYEYLMKSGAYLEILKANDTDYGAANSAEIYTKDSVPPKYGF